MFCYNSQLIWQIDLRDAFLTDRQIKLPLFEHQGDDICEDALKLLKKLVR
jgi:hypothetical protein